MSYNQKFQNELHGLYESDPKFITKFLEYQIQVPLNTKDQHGNTLLHKFIEKKDFKCIDLLLDNLKLGLYNSETKSFILNSKNDSGNTPIHVAVMEGLQKLAKQLHKAGADLSVPNSNDLIISMSDTEENGNTNIFSRLFGADSPKKQLSPNRSNRNLLNQSNFVLDTITSTDSPKSNSSESVDTAMFINFLKKKQLEEKDGGKG